MAYFGFLALFLGIPLAILGLLTIRDLRRESSSRPARNTVLPWIPLFVHVLVAVLYTTPWDNYLVATGVWYYDPDLVTGVRIGWVPVEEYIFFVVQTLLTGLWLLFLRRRIPAAEYEIQQPWKPFHWTAGLLSAVWLASLSILSSGWQPGTYLAIILAWAIPPILLQLFFGADILWHHRRSVSLTLLTVTLYLGLADSFAIGSGTWTIAPDQSLNWHLFGVLPIEELLFFLVTNVLIVFGMTLMLSPLSQARIAFLLKKITKKPSNTYSETS